MTQKTAHLYRMVMPDHLCPFGLKSKSLLQRHGYVILDHHLTNRAETDAFKAEHDVKTTPQTFIENERIGGHDDLRRFFGQHVGDGDEKTYRPVLVIFAVSFLIALAISVIAHGTPLSWSVIPWFVATAMTILALQKLQDVEQFSTMFLSYDLLARRWVPYAYIYPYAEAAAGVLMLAGVALWLAAPLALFVGTVGAISVIKAVYIDKRDLKCACTGGNDNVPLGFISLSENLAMAGMGTWMLIRLIIG
ncbi:glutaredoxin [Sulfitobacter pseudonitzschiae]|uniref:Methylamine utilization protein MauE n=1 Tax=Pseudosulfitobacter pseudonitzschiae TaxID=1402135 RepID=A0A9Q2RYP5_9RHOB|nr:MauE/DoxX family redox-associated membrane protein [Pseudosulfitobacter pseudonitzschiae]MBM2290295.1 glutaredoxin [Pseudosulfitobacter pseudonitzschiae]MBM2295213.1 glutaredoxin [Pseudosulfitobacter pseudonitzschiae]MBM2300125.1 glutaredoxin [Pseudosulfitobacter pseudonitzschiae]MBM2309910.1 glutaredoxin [Pseudosulfitobacter pseudonitzschiae]MBM2314822.1 glutaredoxin [Pseudosulfitobacter pseudonitzschiae]